MFPDYSVQCIYLEINGQNEMYNTILGTYIERVRISIVSVLPIIGIPL